MCGVVKGNEGTNVGACTHTADMSSVGILRVTSTFESKPKTNTKAAPSASPLLVKESLKLPQSAMNTGPETTMSYSAVTKKGIAAKMSHLTTPSYVDSITAPAIKRTPVGKATTPVADTNKKAKMHSPKAVVGENGWITLPSLNKNKINDLPRYCSSIVTRGESNNRFCPIGGPNCTALPSSITKSKEAPSNNGKENEQPQATVPTPSIPDSISFTSRLSYAEVASIASNTSSSSSSSDSGSPVAGSSKTLPTFQSHGLVRNAHIPVQKGPHTHRFSRNVAHFGSQKVG